MDFLKILRSFEEFIFEAATWLIFYPLTLWRVVRQPLTTMAYSDAEQSDSDDRRYDDALSPPLLLLFTILIATIVSLAAHIPDPQTNSAAVKTLYSTPQNLLLFRSLMFSLVPLISAASLLHQQKKHLSRETLRPPFYAQCYLAAPCALFISAGIDIFQRPDLPNAVGVTIMILGVAWFMAVQTRWFRHKLTLGYLAAAWLATWSVLRALIVMIVVLLIVAIV